MQNHIPFRNATLDPKSILLTTCSLATTSGPAHGAGDPRFSKRAPNTHIVRSSCYVAGSLGEQATTVAKYALAQQQVATAAGCDLYAEGNPHPSMWSKQHG